MLLQSSCPHCSSMPPTHCTHCCTWAGMSSQMPGRKCSRPLPHCLVQWMHRTDLDCSWLLSSSPSCSSMHPTLRIQYRRLADTSPQMPGAMCSSLRHHVQGWPTHRMLQARISPSSAAHSYSSSIPPPGCTQHCMSARMNHHAPSLHSPPSHHVTELQA